MYDRDCGYDDMFLQLLLEEGDEAQMAAFLVLLQSKVSSLPVIRPVQAFISAQCAQAVLAADSLSCMSSSDDQKQ